MSYIFNFTTHPIIPTMTKGFRKLTPWVVISASLQFNLLFAFAPKDLPRRRIDVFSMERKLPPVASVHQVPPVRSGTGANTTMADSLIQPYSSPRSYSTSATPTVDANQLSVLYTNDPKEINRWLTEHVPMDDCTIGFDTESVPNFPGYPSQLHGRPVLVQLATTESSLVIPLLNKHKKYTSACLPLLEEVLRDEKIVKCGTGIEEDLLDLKRFVPGLKDLDAKSRLDLGLLGKSNQVGLKTLTRLVLGRSLEKPKRVTISNWSKIPLSNEQIAYSARDAWAGAAVVEELGRRDPEKFGVKALRELLSKQPELKALRKSQRQRRSARRAMRQVKKSLGDASVKQEVERLKQVLKGTDLDYFKAVEELALFENESPPNPPSARQ